MQPAGLAYFTDGRDLSDRATQAGEAVVAGDACEVDPTTGGRAGVLRGADFLGGVVPTYAESGK